MFDSYAQALADVRSCLAALADPSTYRPSVDYDHLLLDIDAMHGGLFPATRPVTGTTSQLHRRVVLGRDTNGKRANWGGLTGKTQTAPGPRFRRPEAI